MKRLCKKSVSILLAILLVVSLFAAVSMTAGATVYYSYEDILFSSLCEGDYITVGVGIVYDKNNEYTVVLKGGTYAQYDLDNKVYNPCDRDLTIENGSCRILTESSFESVYLYSNSNYYSSYINGAKANAFYVESINGNTITFAGTNYAFANESEYFVGNSVTVGGAIGVNFYVNMSPAEAKKATVSFSWMKDGREKTSSVDMSKATLTDNGYVATCQVSASDMTAEITATLTIGNDKVDTDTYTVKEYADYILAHTDVAEYAKAEPLVKAMLNYGAAAQAYFDRNTENLANADLSTDDQKTNSVTAVMINKPYDSTKTNLPDGVEFKKVTLSLMSETTLSLYFESSAELSFSCEGMTVDPDMVDNYQVARIRNIAAKNLGDDFTLTVTAGEDSGSVTYSPMTYCYNVLDKNADSLDLEIMKLQVAVMTLYWYWQEAAAYFAPDSAENVVDLSELEGDYEAQNGEVLTGTLEGNKKITVAAGATITLKDADITSLTDGSGYAGITPLGDATILLKGANTVRGGIINEHGDYPGILAPEGYTLIINGDGSLDAAPGIADGYGCAIGGTNEVNAGDIVINGGTINAVGGDTAAGIGSGMASSCGTIRINGGTVSATGGEAGAGIGSGSGEASCAGVIIFGGTVTATGGYLGAGIGSGFDHAGCADITIIGGTVIATGGEGGAGIGSGMESSCGIITIIGGTVTAAGGKWAAGIGSGTGSTCGNIVIGASVISVTATKGEDSDNAIGAGAYGSCDTVFIEDGAHVTPN